MTKAPLRANEAATLEALHELDLLDTPAEPEFDVLVKAASRICNVPIALVSLVDEDRQWFKAEVGLPGVSETPRDVAFCAHAVLQHDVFEVPDAAKDPRFADNPLVTGSPGIRFYAGAPLFIADGLQIGTLCLLDTLPRQLTSEERNVLKDLASAVAHSIELRFARRRSNARRTHNAALQATTSDVVAGALSAVEVAIDRLFAHGSPVPFTSATDLMAVSPVERERIEAEERIAHQARPAMTAMHFCLTASSALLGITHELLHSTEVKNPVVRERAWKQLGADIKIAGRAAYRAALVLADSLANARASSSTDSQRSRCATKGRSDVPCPHTEIRATQTPNNPWPETD